MSKHLEQLMQKEVTRKQFIGHMGLILVTLLGFGSVISILLGDKKTSRTDSASHGFGSGKFGVK